MGKKFKESLKEEIREEVGDIIYEKAKKEVKQKIKSRYDSFVEKMLSFLGIRQTKRERIKEISEEIREQNNFVISDSILGIVQLFSIEYIKAVIEISGSTLAGKAPDTMKQDKKDQDKNDDTGEHS